MLLCNFTISTKWLKSTTTENCYSKLCCSIFITRLYNLLGILNQMLDLKYIPLFIFRFLKLILVQKINFTSFFCFLVEIVQLQLFANKHCIIIFHNFYNWWLFYVAQTIILYLTFFFYINNNSLSNLFFLFWICCIKPLAFNTFKPNL